jgi:hypothetical protein
LSLLAGTKWGIGSIPLHYPKTNNYLTTIFALNLC